MSGKNQREELRNMVYNTMVDRSKMINVDLIKYVKAGEKDD